MRDNIATRNKAIVEALQAIFPKENITVNNVKVWTYTPPMDSTLNGVSHAKSEGHNVIFYTCEMRDDNFKNFILQEFGVRVIDKALILKEASETKNWDKLDEIVQAIHLVSWGEFSFY